MAMDSLLASDAQNHNGDASHFHNLASKLIREHEQTIYKFRQEVEYLRASLADTPANQLHARPSRTQQIPAQYNLGSPSVSAKLPPHQPKTLLLHPISDTEDAFRGQIDLDDWRPMMGDTSVDLDELLVMNDANGSLYTSADQNSMQGSKSLNGHKLRPTFDVDADVVDSSSSLTKSRGVRKTTNTATTRRSTDSHGTTASAKSGFTQAMISVKTPQAKMNWNLEDIPTQDLWASHVADVLSKRCPACCVRPTRDYLHGWLVWWETLREPERTNILNRLLENECFQFTILVVIFLNTIFVIITTNIDMHDALTSGQQVSSETKAWRLIAETSFTLVYSVELGLKLAVHGLYLFSECDVRWNLFDFVLVIFSVVDLVFQFISSATKRPNLTFLRALRILKFARVLRMVRIVKCVHELKLMMDCVLNSVIHMFWSVILILLVLIMFALLIVQGMRDYVVDQSGGEEAKEVVEGRFDTVQQTMLSLFMATTGGEDWGDQYTIVKRAGLFFELVFVFYISFFAIVAWNIVMSTFVEKAFRLAMPDFESTVMEKRQETLAYARELTHLLVSKLDQDHDGFISLDEFQSQLADPHVKDFFAARDLNLKDAELFFNMLLAVEHTDQVNVNTFVGACLRLRGLATAIDLQALHFEIRNLHQKQDQRIYHMEHLLAGVLKDLSSNHGLRMQGAQSDLGVSKAHSKHSKAVASGKSQPTEHPKIRLDC